MKRSLLLVFTLSPLVGSAQTASAGEVLGDFDGDGLTDIAVIRFSNYTWYILQSNNNLFRALPWGQKGDYPL